MICEPTIPTTTSDSKWMQTSGSIPYWTVQRTKNPREPSVAASYNNAMKTQNQDSGKYLQTIGSEEDVSPLLDLGLFWERRNRRWSKGILTPSPCCFSSPRPVPGRRHAPHYGKLRSEWWILNLLLDASLFRAGRMTDWARISLTATSALPEGKLSRFFAANLRSLESPFQWIRPHVTGTAGLALPRL